jgi:hypothetical protein
LVHESLYAWEFENGNHELKVRVEGQPTFNTRAQLLNSALAGNLRRPTRCSKRSAPRAIRFRASRTTARYSRPRQGSGVLTISTSPDFADGASV